MKSFWNERYTEAQYAYGTEPNDFLKSLPIGSGLKVLCLAEGEGRNGVYLAGLGNDVTCIDYAEEGLKKTSQLAAHYGSLRSRAIAFWYRWPTAARFIVFKRGTSCFNWFRLYGNKNRESVSRGQ